MQPKKYDNIRKQATLNYTRCRLLVLQFHSSVLHATLAVSAATKLAQMAARKAK
jgi:hypothetical protein